jgi:hypothetical protein
MTRLTFDGSFSRSVAKTGDAHIICDGPFGQVRKGWIRDVHVSYFGRELGATVAGTDEDMVHET